MKAAVIGSPISHSLSPVLHNAAYRQLGLDHSYQAIEVDQAQFKDFIQSLDSEWFGLSLTMPLKEIAFDVVSEVSPLAKLTGSINTLTRDSGWKADNTDVVGIAQALREGGASNPKSATLIGAGATARSAIAALSALGIEIVVVLARNIEKSARCIDLGNELGITIDATTEFTENLMSSDVVINTTPKGVADELANRVARARGILLDVVYDPWPTKLVAAWKEKGLIAVPGYQMLLHQAVRQVELMTGQQPEVMSMQLALHHELQSRGLSL